MAAERALEEFRELDGVPPLVRATGATILSLLARRLPDCVASVADYGAAVIEGLAADLGRDGTGPILGVMARLAEAAAAQSAAMLSGSDDLFAASADRFAEAASLAAGVSDDLHALADRLQRVATGMTARSTHRVLLRAGVPRELVRTYAAARPELWTSQVEAIDAGFLDPEAAFVLALPTGSGKTFLAHLRILATLDRWPEGWVAYLAPTRALVREASADLSATLRPHGVRVQRAVAGAEAAAALDEDEIPVVTGARTCAVLTPERLDLYLRSNPDLAASLRAVVVDEAHHIGDESRGPRLETLIAQLRSRAPEAKPVLLSAFMSNIDDVRAWLGVDARAHSSPIRPTRQLRGILLRHDDEALPDSWVAGTGARTAEHLTLPDDWRLRRTSRHRYEVGALVAMDARTPRRSPATPRSYAIPSIASAMSWTEQSRPTARYPNPERKAGGSSVADIAVDVGVALAAHPGLVVMFFPTVAQAQRAAERISERLDDRPDLELYAVAAERIVGRERLLPRLIRRGCGYHHSQMPEDLVRVVEAAARSRLDVLCTTSGLQAGVNLPAAVVVAVGDPRAAPAHPRPNPRDFANMAGRAGRPGQETEGLALYLPAALPYRDPLPAAQAFLAPRDADVALVSALSSYLGQVARDDSITDFADLPEVVQQALLALWAANMRDATSISDFLAHTFGGGGLPGGLGARLADVVTAEATARGARFPVYAKTALPYEAFQAMVDLLPDLAGNLADEQWRGSPTAQAESIAALLLSVPYFEATARRSLGAAFNAPRAASMVRGWVSGEPYDALAMRLGLSTASGARTVKAVNAVTAAIAWGSGALVSLARTGGEFEGVHRLLPYFIRFGVDNSVAAYLRLLGVSDRTGARALATHFPPDAEEDYESVERWSRSPEGRAAIREHYAGDDLARSAAERELGLDEPRRVTADFFTASGDHPQWLAAGAVIEVRREPTGEWRAHDRVSGEAWTVDAVPGAGPAAVLGVVGDRLRGIAFVG